MRLASHKLPISTKFVVRRETAGQIAAHAHSEEAAEEVFAGGGIAVMSDVTEEPVAAAVEPATEEENG
jgi:hypothetical protein